MPIDIPSLAIASSLIKNSPEIELRAKSDSLNLNSKLVAPPDNSLLVKKTSGELLIIISNYFPRERKTDNSGPSMLNSTAASTGGPDLNLSTIIFKSGFSKFNLLARLGNSLTMAL